MRFIKSLPLLTLFSLYASADTFILESGKSLEGKIISEDDESYLLEIQVTHSIKDEKRIKKSEIKEIIKVSEEEIAFNSLKPYLDAPDLSSEKEYIEKIGKLSTFVVKFPDSEHIDFVNKAISKLQDELKSIKEGAIKLNGLIIPESGILANQYDIDASILLKKLHRLHEANSSHDILKIWEKFYPEYSYSSSMEEAVPIMISTLRRYRSQLANLRDTLPSRVKKRKAAMERLNEDDEQRTIEALKEREQLFKTIHQQERETGRIWLTLDDYDNNIINYNLKKTEEVMKLLHGFNPAKTANGGLIYRNAWTAITAGNIAEAESALQEFSRLKIPNKYYDMLNEKLAEKKAEIQVAEAAAQAEKEKKKKFNPISESDPNSIEEKTPDELFDEDKEKKGTFNKLKDRKKRLEELEIE